MLNQLFKVSSLERTIHWSNTDSPKVALILTESQGLALIAARPVDAGEPLLAFDGEIHNWGSTTLNLPNSPPTFLRDHCVQIGEGISRDSSGLARYANHSCDPNCGITNKIWITAIQDLIPGTILTWDYDMTEDNDWMMQCGCGTSLCRKMIGGYRFMPPERREVYSGFLSSWLTANHRPYLGPAADHLTPPPKFED